MKIIVLVSIFLLVLFVLGASTVSIKSRKADQERCVELYGEGYGFDNGGFGADRCIAPDGEIKGYWQE